MEGTSMASCGIVREVLTRYNYEEWQTLTKNYLRGKNLWNVVAKRGSDSTDMGARRNAEALHIIQLSCGPKIFDEIKHFETAETAWNHLATVYGSELQAESHIRLGVEYDNVIEHKDLYEFVEKGDWGGAGTYMRDKPDAIFWAPASGRTVLHVATMRGHVRVVEGLVNLGKQKLIEMQDEDGYTALALAAGYSGETHIAKCIVNGNGGEEVLAIPNKKGEIPLLLAAYSGHEKMTRFLYYKTPSRVLKQQPSRNRVLLLERCIQAHIFDVALGILKSCKEVLTESLPYGFGGLHELARMPVEFFSDRQIESTQRKAQGLMERLLYKTDIPNYEVLEILKYYKDCVAKFSSSQLREAAVYDAMLDAAKHGNVEFINAMKEANHDLLWAMDKHGRGIFSYAVLHRKVNVFRLIYNLPGIFKDTIKYRRDTFGNNLLHLAAHLGPLSNLNLRHGAVLQMRREIECFKAVEKIVHPKCREDRNDEGKKPGEIFIETHEELMRSGEKWAKETANTFALVGILVITVMFAALFTLPGGYHQESGVPVFLNEKAFTTFIVADVISVSTSIMVVFKYIDIQTSRYAEIDFLDILPNKILSGLLFLSLSLVSMMVAFFASLSIVLQNYFKYKQLFISLTLFAGLPFTLLIPLLILPLLIPLLYPYRYHYSLDLFLRYLNL